MFLLTHAYTALAVVGKLDARDRDYLIVGSVLPDVAELRIAPEPLTHMQGIRFMKSVGKEYKYLGLGVVLHGTSPHGLDYYTHNRFYSVDGSYKLEKITRESGCIARMYDEIAPLVMRYRKSLKMPQDDAVHFVVEFCFDHLTAQRDRKLAALVYKALRNSLDTRAVDRFAQFFDVDKKQMKRLKHVVKSRQTKKILTNFSSVHGTAHNLQHFSFLKSLREEHRARYKFLGRLNTIARSSLGFLQAKVHDKALVEMFEECVEIVRRDYDDFMSETISEMKRMVKKEKLV